MPKSTKKLARASGYVSAYDKTHPRAQWDGFIPEHILVAEKALGKYLPEGAEVHHINQVKHDNRPQNLVICQDSSYHQILHRRMRALSECGDANFRRCHFCKQYDDPNSERMRLEKRKKPANCYVHLKCYSEYKKSLWLKSKQSRKLSNELVAKERKLSSMAKLDQVKAVEIREMYASGQYLQRELAEIFSMSQAIISDVINQKRWKDV